MFPAKMSLLVFCLPTDDHPREMVVSSASFFNHFQSLFEVSVLHHCEDVVQMSSF